MTTADDALLLERLLTNADIDAPTGCWVWSLPAASSGHPRISHPNGRGIVAVYRLIYELTHGDVPAGLHLDHLCRNPRCVNPDHLEPVTARENSRRGAVDRRADVVAGKPPRPKPAGVRGRYGAGNVQHLGGDRYRLAVSLGKDPVTGERRRATRVVRASSKRAAQTLLNGFLTEQHARHDGSTLGGVLTEYLELAAANGMSPTTKAENEGAVARYIPEHLLAVRLRDLSARHLDQLYAHLLRQGGVCRRRGVDEHGQPKKCTTAPCKHGGGNPLSPATVDRLHTVVEAALEQAVRWDYAVVNVARRTRPIEVVAQEVQLPPAADLVKLLAALDKLTLDGHDVADGSPLPDFVALDLATGCRPAELCALRWGNVDLDRADGDGNRYGMLVIAEAVARARGGAIVKSTKTNKVRRVTVSAEVCELLDQRRARWRALALAAGIPLDDMAVFPSKSRPERPWRPDSIGRELRLVRDELGLSTDITFRNLRHYCVSVLAAEHVDVVTAAKRMGHSPQIMLSVYAHLFEAPDLVAAGILGRQATNR